MAGRIKAWYFTHNGGVRTNNEDGLLIGDILITDSSMKRPETTRTGFDGSVFCVADGIGGEQKGEVASYMVLSGIRDNQDRIRGDTTLSNTLYQAKDQLDTYATEHPKAGALGCTLSGICIRGKTGIAFNVGDCRVYRINGAFFEQVTRDHSLVYALYEEGIIGEDEIRRHPKRNVVTSSVSGDGLPDSLKIYITEMHLRNDDSFFICSDGIWGCFSHDELEMIYRKFQGYRYCQKILGAALARRASDNISAILVHISSAG
jgi:protein phosphatase